MEARRSSSAVVPLLNMIFLMINAGLLLWLWRASRAKEPDYGSFGFALASAPAAPLPALPRPEARRPALWLEGPERNLIKEPDLRPAGKAPKTAAARAPRARAKVPGPGKISPEARGLVERAARAYFALKRSPRFRDSAAIRAWKMDFLSQSELKSADERFRRDHDAARFLVELGRSPGFWSLLQKHLAAPDIQAFIQEMRAQPALAGASPELLRDFNLAAAVAWGYGREGAGGGAPNR